MTAPVAVLEPLKFAVVNRSVAAPQCHELSLGEQGAAQFLADLAILAQQ